MVWIDIKHVYQEVSKDLHGICDGSPRVAIWLMPFSLSRAKGFGIHVPVPECFLLVTSFNSTHAARFETLNRCLIYVPAHAFVRLLLEVVQGLTTDGSFRAAGCCKHV